MLSPDHRTRLLHLARHALDARVRRRPAPRAADDLRIAVAGAFVTVRVAGALRGCLGALDDGEWLGDVIVRLAGEVAVYDRRFDPIRIEDLVRLTLDISVLTPPELVRNVCEILVGRDGLIVRDGRRTGLLLPQVAVEHGWDCETFLGHTCLKAGLALDAWRNGAEILRFEAEVFGDDHPSVDG